MGKHSSYLNLPTYYLPNRNKNQKRANTNHILYSAVNSSGVLMRLPTSLPMPVYQVE